MNIHICIHVATLICTCAYNNLHIHSQVYTHNIFGQCSFDYCFSDHIHIILAGAK